jgi:hypothetical protein
MERTVNLCDSLLKKQVLCCCVSSKLVVSGGITPPRCLVPLVAS